MPNKILIISDYDGCLEKLNKFVKLIGIKPIIVTGRPPSEELKTIKELEGVEYQKLFVYPRNYESNAFTGQMKKDIAQWKGEMVQFLKKNAKLTIFIDDDLNYWMKVREMNSDVLCFLI